MDSRSDERASLDRHRSTTRRHHARLHDSPVAAAELIVRARGRSALPEASAHERARSLAPKRDLPPRSIVTPDRVVDSLAVATSRRPHTASSRASRSPSSVTTSRERRAGPAQSHAAHRGSPRTRGSRSHERVHARDRSSTHARSAAARQRSAANCVFTALRRAQRRLDPRSAPSVNVAARRASTPPACAATVERLFAVALLDATVRATARRFASLDARAAP